ncbi:alpha/beta fold hydrolase [bacterium]|nr:alpha/beta fold hydrolase [bacterium]
MPQPHYVGVSGGDTIVLHEDRPKSVSSDSPCVLFVHGLSGSHASPYMVRFAERFLSCGFVVFRVDMRGCGSGAEMSGQLTHAGRSQDVIAALSFIAERYPQSDLYAAGISLGAAQLLRAAGRVGTGEDASPSWFHRMRKIAAVAPPIDLLRCSDHMQKRTLRLYNYYFIRTLLSRIPERLQQDEIFQRQMRLPRPRTLRELDDRLTAPLSGFDSALDYYQKSSCNEVASSITVPTLVLASEDDPIVPVGCFTDDSMQWSPSTHLMLTKSGGHAGYIGPGRICWMDSVIEKWFVHHSP